MHIFHFQIIYNILVARSIPISFRFLAENNKQIWFCFEVYNRNHVDNLKRYQTKVLCNEIVYHQLKITIDF